MLYVGWQISSIQDSLRTFNENVTRIGDLHSRSLNNMDDAAAQRNAAQLDELVADTSALSATLKRRIKAIEKQGGSGRDGQIRKQQVKLAGMDGYDFLLSRLCYCVLDKLGQEQIRGCHSKLPDRRATVPSKVQATYGTAI